jgi:hypothetical protein
VTIVAYDYVNASTFAGGKPLSMSAADAAGFLAWIAAAASLQYPIRRLEGMSTASCVFLSCSWLAACTAETAQNQWEKI